MLVDDAVDDRALFGDMLKPPVDPTRLISLVRDTLRSNEATVELEPPAVGAPPLGPIFEGMLGASPAMQRVFARIAKVASTSAPVLIVGESGTGKELVARAVHNQSRRKSGPFVPVHTGAIPKELVSSELFGHERGAFTGAANIADGKFAAAEGGTLFLDEVGTMDVPTQISLLRVLETFRFTRVGGTREYKADVRIVAATNSDLLDAVDRGTFREDLYYRLNVFTVSLPPLRDRREDVPAIAERFLRLAGQRYEVAARSLSPAAVQRLLDYSWPGNVRELRNAMDQVAVLARGEIVQADELELVRARLPSARHASTRESIGASATDSTASAEPLMTSDSEVVEASSDGAQDVDERSAALPESPMDVTPVIADRPAPSFVAPSSNDLTPGDAAPAGDHPLIVRVPIGTPLAEVERLLIMKTISASSGNKQRAARILGISRRGLYMRLAAYGEADRARGDQTSE